MYITEVAKQESFDGHRADTILEAIRSFLRPLDDKTVISLWRQTETGMCDDTDEECLFPDCCRMDLEMELLQEITSLAWEEAEERCRSRLERGPVSRREGARSVVA